MSYAAALGLHHDVRPGNGQETCRDGGPQGRGQAQGKGGGDRPPVKAEGPKHNALSIRDATEGRDWLTRLSDHCRLKTAHIIARALIISARHEGFNEPLPKR